MIFSSYIITSYSRYKLLVFKSVPTIASTFTRYTRSPISWLPAHQSFSFCVRFMWFSTSWVYFLAVPASCLCLPICKVSSQYSKSLTWPPQLTPLQSFAWLSSKQNDDAEIMLIRQGTFQRIELFCSFLRKRQMLIWHAAFIFCVLVAWSYY